MQFFNEDGKLINGLSGMFTDDWIFTKEAYKEVTSNYQKFNGDSDIVVLYYCSYFRDEETTTLERAAQYFKVSPESVVKRKGVQDEWLICLNEYYKKDVSGETYKFLQSLEVTYLEFDEKWGDYTLKVVHNGKKYQLGCASHEDMSVSYDENSTFINKKVDAYFGFEGVGNVLKSFAEEAHFNEEHYIVIENEGYTPY